MADKLMIVMVNTDPSDPSELGAPFFQATVAAAMEYEVEVILTGRAGELAIKGVAEKLHVQEGSPKSVYDFIKDSNRFLKLTQSLCLVRHRLPIGDNLLPFLGKTDMVVQSMNMF